MKENFTTENKPFAKVLSNKKIRRRKKKLLGRTAFAANSGALLFVGIPCRINNASLRIDKIYFLFNKTPVWMNKVPLLFIQIPRWINRTSSLFDKIPCLFNSIPFRINTTPLPTIRALLLPSRKACLINRIACYFIRKQTRAENASPRNST